MTLSKSVLLHLASFWQPQVLLVGFIRFTMFFAQLCFFSTFFLKLMCQLTRLFLHLSSAILQLIFWLFVLQLMIRHLITLIKIIFIYLYFHFCFIVCWTCGVITKLSKWRRTFFSCFLFLSWNMGCWLFEVVLHFIDYWLHGLDVSDLEIGELSFFWQSECLFYFVNILISFVCFLILLIRVLKVEFTVFLRDNWLLKRFISKVFKQLYFSLGSKVGKTTEGEVGNGISSIDCIERRRAECRFTASSEFKVFPAHSSFFV